MFNFIPFLPLLNLKLEIVDLPTSHIWPLVTQKDPKIMLLRTLLGRESNDILQPLRSARYLRILRCLGDLACRV